MAFLESKHSSGKDREFLTASSTNSSVEPYSPVNISPISTGSKPLFSNIDLI